MNNYFQNCRVVVVDDRIEEIQPILKALNRQGISHLYFAGDRREDLPEKPLTGVRVIILDMRLGDTGTAKQVAAKTAHTFSTIVSPTNGPLIVLLWTNHPEDVEAFQEALYRSQPDFLNSLFIVDLKKPSKVTAATSNQVSKRIAEILGSLSPIDFLWAWEQTVHIASSEVASLIASQAVLEPIAEESDAERRARWLRGLKGLLRTLAVGAGGEASLATSAERDLLETLGELLNDQLEQKVASHSPKYLTSINVVAPVRLSTEGRARLNGQLLLGSSPADLRELRPSYVYICNDAQCKTLKGIKVSWESILLEILENLPADQEIKAINKEIRKERERKPSDESKIRLLESRIEARKAHLYTECHRFYLDISPSCDFTQRAHRKQHVSKVAAGLLIPQSSESLLNSRSDSLRVIEPVVVPGLAGVWIPVLSGRALFSVPTHPSHPKGRSTFRFRNSLLTDVRNWYAGRFSRAGYLSIPK